jgi:hypothetical protein
MLGLWSEYESLLLDAPSPSLSLFTALATRAGAVGAGPDLFSRSRFARANHRLILY